MKDIKRRGILYVGKDEMLDLKVNNTVYVLHVASKPNNKRYLDKLKQYFLKLHHTNKTHENVTCVYHDAACSQRL